jgi:hypothetical protein
MAFPQTFPGAIVGDRDLQVDKCDVIQKPKRLPGSSAQKKQSKSEGFGHLEKRLHQGRLFVVGEQRIEILDA